MTASTRPDTPPLAPVRAGALRPEQIAHVVHEANRAVQLEQADPTIPVAPPWESCGDEMRASAIDGVRAVLAGASPEQSHENWVRFKVEHGWTLGPVKDEVRKEHPLLVPYAELPPEQRLKDALFGAIVHAASGQPDPRCTEPECAYFGQPHVGVFSHARTEELRGRGTFAFEAGVRLGRLIALRNRWRQHEVSVEEFTARAVAILEGEADL